MIIQQVKQQLIRHGAAYLHFAKYDHAIKMHHPKLGECEHLFAYMCIYRMCHGPVQAPLTPDDGPSEHPAGEAVADQAWGCIFSFR
jgi:hypothetical protein